GNELLVAIVSSPENMANLEAIRQNNLRLTGLLADQAADPQLPAIVWLSYNVHGNEASSSEVAMVLLHQLVAGKDAAVAEWLKKVVVIIDPCLNPDGRERYISWYNRMVGRYPNPDINSREHDEPWPGGRTNHYNFDLNRDWAWQTQVETQQRLALYQQWMPVIHSDYHEQYPDNPYYFAPAAEPFHEAISGWQRSFQQVIGKNHARYFDAQGWLYFTRELFDLFYPAYGDTYPIFNGAIGMTFEQAGHGVGGLAVIKSDGDTLTLKDRIAHHLTTSLSTIEIASKQATALNQEFKKYYDEAQRLGSGAYQHFILDGSNEAKAAALRQLLDRNQIRYSAVKEGQRVTGFNYFSGKEESYTTRKTDWLVSTTQPKGVLARVLFEPNARLVDSVTYDITAWSMPYAYGIAAMAVKGPVVASRIVEKRVS
ncbi:MAG TPA: M14 family metallopeptidase, partial [Ferruginibacter sp.]|nr:M14 family metallopeptidase [Ferruginibacter sp.]